jgi:diguanylate cyclase (GGDEF)-like protein
LILLYFYKCICISRKQSIQLFCAFLLLISAPLSLSEEHSFTVNEEHNLTSDYQKKLLLANSIRTTNRDLFNKIISELTLEIKSLSIKQKVFLLYLQGYQKIIAGELNEGIALLDLVINQDEFISLKHRAIITKVSVYNIGENYQEGFIVLNKLLPMLVNMTDKSSYQEALFVIAVFYNRLTQYQLSQKYLTKIVESEPSVRLQCTSSMLQVEAALRLNELTWENINDNKVALCEQEHEYLASSIIYGHISQWYLENNAPKLALDLLINKLTLAEKTQYYLLINHYNSLIAQSYLMLNDLSSASLYAQKVLDIIKPSYRSESIVKASHVLYKINKQQNNFAQALKYHEIYQTHFQLINDDQNKRKISYQVAQEEVIKKSHQISLLGGKNKVLELEKLLFESASQKKQFLIILLIIVILALSYWAYLSKKAQLRLKDMAEHDELTGIFNRHSFNELASSALNYCNKTNQEVSLILFDLDNFKRINDSYGHDIGDWVLKKTIQTCQQLSRKNDIIGRFGGEEFTILLPGCNDTKASELAEKYRKAIFAITTEETGYKFQISASFGICPSLAKNKTLHDVIKAADQAMYHAKRNGRNQVSIYGMYTAKVAP